MYCNVFQPDLYLIHFHVNCETGITKKQSLNSKESESVHYRSRMFCHFVLICHHLIMIMSVLHKLDTYYFQSSVNTYFSIELFTDVSMVMMTPQCNKWCWLIAPPRKLIVKSRAKPTSRHDKMCLNFFYSVFIIFKLFLT